jgi:PhzF family phenazine biosynthesis protein
MRIRYYQVDAFTDRVFSGNPAGVCFLESWLPDAVLQQIALENNLSETAFALGSGGEFELRWMTPEMEVDLCGHATLAPAFLIFSEFRYTGESITFHTKAGRLGASRKDDLIVLDFPAWTPQRCEVPPALAEALGWIPRELYKNRDYLAVFANEEEVASLKPDMPKLAQLECLGVICTAPGKECDFVSRFFAPRAGVPEDPVTGSAHSSLTPYWARKLGRQKLHARQLSTRGGELWCEDRGERVGIGGKCALYSRAEIEVPSHLPDC